jgi:uncharacterized membrane protein
MTRNGAIDRLRGIVMVLMALDHARDFFGEPRDPTNMATTTIVLFFTRWITHYCAPVFVLLAGTSAFMMLNRGDSKKDVSKFLLTRGVWLLFLELTIVRVGWLFDLSWRFSAFQVIWAIGWSMIALAALVFAPPRVVGALGVAMIALHNLLDHTQLGPKWLAMILHAPGILEVHAGYRIFVAYPLIPWIGVIAVGFALGEVFTRKDRQRVLIRMGIAAIVAFVVIRGFNHYGDPKPWSAEHHPVLSFLNCTKYPPSLDYLLMTLGPAMLALAALEHVELKPFEIVGRVPLFYYIAHLYLLHLGAVIVAYVVHGENIFGKPFFMGGARVSLLSVYLAWAIGLLLLYPMCVWYAALKARRRDVWVLRYL